VSTLARQGAAPGGGTGKAGVAYAPMERFLLIFPVLLFSVVIHEYAHGWVALKQGDDTALSLGRLTLNPIPHLDLFGSILVPAMLALSGTGFLFGWAKPVPVDPRKFRNYKRGDILVSIAGIVANLILALLFTLVVILSVHATRAFPGMQSQLQVVHTMAQVGILINLILAFFNLLPIPPLDGSHVMFHLLPARLGAQYRELSRFGFLILMGLLFFVPQVRVLFVVPAMALKNLADVLIQLWT
jgi:Zn-dependent protease